MILEAVILNIKPGGAAAFEAAFQQAAPIIAASPGYVGHELHRCLENDHQFIFLVRWRRLQDHTEGFRGSAAYQEWKRLLHPFYDPFPIVLHYELVHADGGGEQ